jgi:hypothetical protein
VHDNKPKKIVRKKNGISTARGTWPARQGRTGYRHEPSGVQARERWSEGKDLVQRRLKGDRVPHAESEFPKMKREGQVSIALALALFMGAGRLQPTWLQDSRPDLPATEEPEPNEPAV